MKQGKTEAEQKHAEAMSRERASKTQSEKNARASEAIPAVATGEQASKTVRESV